MDGRVRRDETEDMRTRRAQVLTIAVAAALACLPAAAIAKPPAELPGPGAGMPAKAKAYGRYCQGQSKEHVEGQRGTPFSLCVTAMAKLAKGKTDSPKRACKELSKERTPGEKGTPFSRCVKGARQLLEPVPLPRGPG